MCMIKDKIEDHLRATNEVLEVQAGFTVGGRVEDNLLILNYCVQESYAKGNLYLSLLYITLKHLTQLRGINWLK